MKDITFNLASAFETLFLDALSLASASHNTSTKGSLPDKNTASSSLLILLLVAIFNQINVFPAPGTPVKNIIDFLFVLLDSSIISSILCSVSFKNISFEEYVFMSSTSCVS